MGEREKNNLVESAINTPIPETSVEGWKDIPVKECGERLVPLGIYSQFPYCDTSAAYFGEKGFGAEVNFLGKPIPEANITHFVRKSVREKLTEAQSLLPRGYYFKFFDGFRPLSVQQKLFDMQLETTRKNNPDLSEEELMIETQKFVSLPSPNKKMGTKHPSPHSTGGAIDLTLVTLPDEAIRFLEETEEKYKAGTLAPTNSDHPVLSKRILFELMEQSKRFKWSDKDFLNVLDNWANEYEYHTRLYWCFTKYSKPELNLGTNFDHFGEKAKTTYYENVKNPTEEEQRIRDNRRLLYHVLTSVGLTNYPEEWWHYCYGDNMNAVLTNKPYAIYGGATPSEENLYLEGVRRNVYKTSLQMIGKGHPIFRTIGVDPRL